MTIDEVDEQFATRFAERFADAWRSPDLAKHEAMWAEDIVLSQPMMGTLRGKQACPAGWDRLVRIGSQLFRR
ncbi:nuclear transport factor 2 family protein [Mycolicibacterium holsaticum]|jgi:ketosteroid isomerase-like protein|uniref:nuclear transport factor 2 family protein n=1 Tax=Mycolicibacterium holsaticum TaxID=152142 RepID=UPI001C7DA5FE|nr:nuclear transport factor 2 family protein [Mycolicibacterium holsaticum]MDA4107452.1 hypothetical protein [Mycolicibacterium holsaticum DSM 44478 = JCM 12374]QZA10844.1 nuclear transport factor 2 family protein [Mycolicibacterium holsaticum DSM 44478 = JCM 12374]UNC11655.1 nuclear transport factor 2 family protein [Mycolicibacterium holsaticum DSM 44478 = JCM 12374]